MKFVFLGDVHGNLQRCVDVCKQYPSATVVQIGDLGVGFVSFKALQALPDRFRFFVGNHDNRQLARKLPHCLGDFGEAYNRFFFVSGADSVDREQRIEGVSWWPDEELTYRQATECLEQWEKSSTSVLVSHDCPQLFAESYKLIYDKTLTRNLLSEMIRIRKPSLIITGHHHSSVVLKHDEIKWRQLDIDETYVVDI